MNFYKNIDIFKQKLRFLELKNYDFSHYACFALFLNMVRIVPKSDIFIKKQVFFRQK